MRKNKSLWVWLLSVFIVFFLFFSNDFGLVDVQRTAIITGLALDEEDDSLLLTADLAVPSASQKGENTSPLQVSAHGKTVAEALETIGEKVGWSPRLVYCRVLLLGESLAERDVFSYLSYFLRNEYFSDNCLVVTTQGKAKDLLSVRTPVDNIVTLALQKILSGEAYATGKCVAVSLKDFAIGYYGESKSGFLPVVKTVEPVKAALNTDSGESSPQESEKKPQSEKVFSVSDTALFYEGKKTGELNEEETFALSLLRNSLRNSAYRVKVGDTEYCLNLKRNDGKITFAVKNGTPQLAVNLSAQASLSDRTKRNDVESLSSSSLLPVEVKAVAENSLKENYRALFEKGKSSRCDVYGILKKLRRYESDYFTAYEKDILRLTRPTFSVKILSAAR